MICLRILGSYPCRLTRRLSTCVTLSTFIITVFIILQLYARRHSIGHLTQLEIGESQYRPGLFLSGVQPSNSSYCQFNYGFPDVLDWNNISVYPSPESGLKHYRVIYNVVTGTAYSNVSRYEAVTYATQVTPEFIYHVVEIARFWEGPISLAVYTPDYDIDLAIQIINHLCHCYPGMAKVSVHFFYPKHVPPKLIRESPPQPTKVEVGSNITEEQLLQFKLENYRKIMDNNSKYRAEFIEQARKNKIKRMMSNMPTKRTAAAMLNFPDCSGLDSFDMLTYRRDTGMVYPINVGRNVARNASKTNYFIVSDIEFLPSEGLASKFVTMLRKTMGGGKRDKGCVYAKAVFVVPLFEVAPGELIPRNKKTLVKMVEENRAWYFHKYTCTHCQRFPGLTQWLKTPSSNGLKPMLTAHREYPYHRWEPLYFGTKQEPWYSEALSWEGRQDKMTQMLELCLKEYRLVLLDGGFLCHSAPTKPGLRFRNAERLNNRRYLKIIRSLKKRYRDRPQCKVEYGTPLQH